MKSDFDQMADSSAQRKAERLLDEASEQAIDTARQALFRVQRATRRSIDRFVCSKIVSAVMLAATALSVAFCSQH